MSRISDMFVGRAAADNVSNRPEGDKLSATRRDVTDRSRLIDKSHDYYDIPDDGIKFHYSWVDKLAMRLGF